MPYLSLSTITNRTWVGTNITCIAFRCSPTSVALAEESLIFHLFCFISQRKGARPVTMCSKFNLLRARLATCLLWRSLYCSLYHIPRNSIQPHWKVRLHQTTTWCWKESIGFELGLNKSTTRSTVLYKFCTYSGRKTYLKPALRIMGT
jgi:hypothetical protein